jgi:hypothetical protein
MDDPFGFGRQPDPEAWWTQDPPVLENTDRNVCAT